MRRWRRREMCGGGAGHLPRKKSFFVPKMMVGCILPQFLTGRKRKASRRWFYIQWRNYKAYKNSAKLSKTSRWDQRDGGRTTSWIRHCTFLWIYNYYVSPTLNTC